MFELDQSATYVESKPEEVIDIYTSINRSTVAAPGRTPEPAQAYIATVYRGGPYEVAIYLYLTSSNSGLIYKWDEGPVPPERVNDLYNDALQFAESMGFMMDDLRYRDKSPQQKTESFNEIPMFHADLSFLKAQEEEVEAEEGGGDDELLIEPLDQDSGESSAPAQAEDAEEINLDILGEGEDVTPQSAGDDVAEINLDMDDDGGEAVPLAGEGDDLEIDIPMDDSPPAPPSAPKKSKPVKAPQPEPEVEEIDLGGIDEQTVEAAPVKGAVVEPKKKTPPPPPPADDDEELMGSFDADDAGGEDMDLDEGDDIDIDIDVDDGAADSAGEEEEDINIDIGPEPEPEPEPKPAPKAAAKPPEPPPPPKREPVQTPAPAAKPSGSAEGDDMDILVRLLAMM